MKRLIKLTAKTRRTDGYQIDTQQELEFIRNIDEHLTPNKHHGGQTDLGMWGDTYYRHEQGLRFYLYVVENFIYKDVRRDNGDQHDVVVRLVFPLHRDNNVEKENPRYEIIENGTIADAKITEGQIAGENLIGLNARNYQEAIENLTAQFPDFNEDMIQ